MQGVETLAKARSPGIVVRDAGIVLLVSAAIGLAVNFLRPHGIPFVQKSQYQILVPCPEGSGDAPGLSAEDSAIADPRTMLVDARPTVDHTRWHPKAAVNLPFDYLTPAPSAEVRKIASSGAARVVVFGDGGDPDTGEQLARELAGSGIRNVFFVKGGAAAVEKSAVGKGAP